MTAATGPRPVPDPRVVALARDMERLARRTRPVTDQVGELTPERVWASSTRQDRS